MLFEEIAVLKKSSLRNSHHTVMDNPQIPDLLIKYKISYQIDEQLNKKNTCAINLEKCAINSNKLFNNK